MAWATGLAALRPITWSGTMSRGMLGICTWCGHLKCRDLVVQRGSPTPISSLSKRRMAEVPIHTTSRHMLFAPFPPYRRGDTRKNLWVKVRVFRERVARCWQSTRSPEYRGSTSYKARGRVKLPGAGMNPGPAMGLRAVLFAVLFWSQVEASTEDCTEIDLLAKSAAFGDVGNR